MKPWKRKVRQKEKWKTLKKERMKPNNNKKIKVQQMDVKERRWKKKGQRRQ